MKKVEGKSPIGQDAMKSEIIRRLRTRKSRFIQAKKNPRGRSFSKSEHKAWFQRNVVTTAQKLSERFVSFGGWCVRSCHWLSLELVKISKSRLDSFQNWLENHRPAQPKKKKKKLF